MPSYAMFTGSGKVHVKLGNVSRLDQEMCMIVKSCNISTPDQVKCMSSYSTLAGWTKKSAS